MATEIERKFLVINNDWKQQAYKQEHYIQAYLCTNEKSSSRIRICNDRANLNIKSSTIGITRAEYDYELPIDEAKEIVENLCERPFIEKTRYFVKHGKHVWEIDVFARENEGLTVAEIELGSVEETFDKPSWVGEDVSDDPKYYNVLLVTKPFNTWPNNQK